MMDENTLNARTRIKYSPCTSVAHTSAKYGRSKWCAIDAKVSKVARSSSGGLRSVKRPAQVGQRS